MITGAALSPTGFASSKSLLEADHSRNDEPASIGLRNVHERIQIFYGIQYGVDIDSMIGEGTSVTITIPGKGDE
ncbi:hypothetical protein P7H12_20820 [Paenibacillus larvae]|nr:hypothetical protein [Paenibacillus larvae]MDT2265524.1 hypothetical protein [Paenibacillus larvae]